MSARTHNGVALWLQVGESVLVSRYWFVFPNIVCIVCACECVCVSVSGRSFTPDHMSPFPVPRLTCCRRCSVKWPGRGAAETGLAEFEAFQTIAANSRWLHHPFTPPTWWLGAVQHTHTHTVATVA